MTDCLGSGTSRWGILIAICWHLVGFREETVLVAEVEILRTECTETTRRTAIELFRGRNPVLGTGLRRRVQDAKCRKFPRKTDGERLTMVTAFLAVGLILAGLALVLVWHRR